MDFKARTVSRHKGNGVESEKGYSMVKEPVFHEEIIVKSMYRK